MATTKQHHRKIAPMFTELLIKKIECLKTDWQKPWITSLEQGLPCNIRGTLYNGGNVLMLLFYTEFMKFTLPVFLTFNQAKEEDLSVSKGARSFPSIIGSSSWYTRRRKKTIKYEEYRKLPATEQKKLQGHPADELQRLQHRPDRFCRGNTPERYERMKGRAARRLFGQNDLRGVGRACSICKIGIALSRCSIPDSAYYSPSFRPYRLPAA